MNHAEGDSSAPRTYWLVRWATDEQTITRRVLELGGQLLGRRRDGAWRATLPGSSWRGIDVAPEAVLEPESVVHRVRRPLRRPPLQAPAGAGGAAHIIRVIDQETRHPLEQVVVILEGRSGLSYRARTDAEGVARLEVFEREFVRLEVLPPDAYWPAVVHPGISGEAGAPLQVALPAISPVLEPYGWGFTRAMKIDQVHAAGYRGRGVRVAVLDTGVSAHPDLEIQGGVNTADVEEAGRWQDTHWHGTHVAGVVAAAGKPAALVGVAPEAALFAVRVGKVDGSDEFRFSNLMFETDLLEGIQWCLDNGIEVMNLSLFSRQTPALEEAIAEAYHKGVVMVAPTGNRRSGPLGLEESGVDYPASNPFVISVGAIGRLGTYPRDSYFVTAEEGARFSPRFPDYYVPGFSKSGRGLDFVAPGVAILSTVPGTLKGWDVDNQRLSGYTSWMGTSQAAPFVTGLVCLLLEAHPEIRRLTDGRKVDAVREVLTRSAISLHLDPLFQGAGLPFAPACVQAGQELG